MAIMIQSLERRAADTHEEAGIGLLVDQPVLLEAVPSAWKERLGRAVVGVEPGVEEAVIGGVPDAAAAGVGDLVGKVLAAGEVAHAQREEFRALVVEGPQQLAVVGRMVDAAEAEIGLAFGLARRRRA